MSTLVKLLLWALVFPVGWVLFATSWVNIFGSSMLKVMLKSLFLFTIACIWFHNCAHQIPLPLCIRQFFDRQARLEYLKAYVRAQERRHRKEQERMKTEIRLLQDDVQPQVIVPPKDLQPRVKLSRKMAAFFVVLVCLGALSMRIANLEGRMTDMEAWREVAVTQIDNLGQKISDVNKHVDQVAEQMNATYTDLLKDQDSHWKTFDDALLTFASVVHRVDKIEKFPALRQFLGVGCYPQGTMIQTDAKGSLAPIETLRGGDSVWNPDLNKKVMLSLTVVGNETGTLYTFKTADKLSVQVTSTHPMKIMTEVGGTTPSWVNLPALAVQEGSWTMTINGVQQIISIEKREVIDMPVFNLQYALPESVPMTSRSVVADGVQTLDFAAQRVHAQVKMQHTHECT